MYFPHSTDRFEMFLLKRSLVVFLPGVCDRRANTKKKVEIYQLSVAVLSTVKRPTQCRQRNVQKRDSVIFRMCQTLVISALVQ